MMSSSSDDHNNSNICPICLASLFGPAGGGDDSDNGDGVGDISSNHNNTSSSSTSRNDICATVPCGHLYHHTCFGRWQASQPQLHRGGAKCPTCNVRTTACVKLFLSLDGLAVGAGDDDDDVSLSSAEHDDDDDRDGEGCVDVDDDGDAQTVSREGRLQRGRDGEASEKDGSSDGVNNDNNNDDDEEGRTPNSDSPRTGRVVSETVATSQPDETLATGSAAAVVVDLTLSPQQQNQTGKRRLSPQSSGAATGGTIRVRSVRSRTPNGAKAATSGEAAAAHRATRIAKKYKRRFLQQNAQCRSLHEEKNRLSDLVRDGAARVERLREENDKCSDSLMRMDISLNAALLNELRAKRGLDAATVENRDLKQERNRLSKENADLHTRYKMEVENTRARSLAEVQQVLEEHPKIVEENRRLKEHLLKLEAPLGVSHDRKHCRDVGGGRTVTNGKSSTTAKEMARALKQLDNEVRNKAGHCALLSANNNHHTVNHGKGIGTRKQPPPSVLPNAPARAAPSVDAARYSSMASRMIAASSYTKGGGGGGGASKHNTFVKAMMLSSSTAPNNNNVAGSKRSSDGAATGGVSFIGTSLSIASHNKRPKTNSALRRGIFDRPP